LHDKYIFLAKREKERKGEGEKGTNEKITLLISFTLCSS